MMMTISTCTKFGHSKVRSYVNYNIHAMQSGRLAEGDACTTLCCTKVNTEHSVYLPKNIQLTEQISSGAPLTISFNLDTKPTTAGILLVEY